MATITILDKNSNYIEYYRQNADFNFYCGSVLDYIPIGQIVYYVSPSNSLLFYDGGIDAAYQKMFGASNLVKISREYLSLYGKESKLGRKYLPIGSAFCYDFGDKKLISAPTMLLPQNVSETENAYYATKAIQAILGKDIHKKEIEIIIPGLCCGYGGMSFEKSIDQQLMAFYYNQFASKEPTNVYINEPNLKDQPDCHMNTEFK